MQSLRPPTLERSLAVWRGFRASLGIQGAVRAQMLRRKVWFYRPVKNDFPGSVGKGPRFENRADNRRFPIPFLPHGPVLRRRTIITTYVFFSMTRFCPSLIMGLFFN